MNGDHRRFPPAPGALALAALRRFLRTVPDAVHTAMVSRLLNHALRGQPIRDQLAPLCGTCLSLCITDTHNVWRLVFDRDRFAPARGRSEREVRITGRLADLMRLATRAEDPDTLFFSRRLCLEGDTETALYVKNLLDALEFDWAAHLTDLVGPRAATAMLRAGRRTGVDRRLDRAVTRIRNTIADLAARDGEPDGE